MRNAVTAGMLLPGISDLLPVKGAPGFVAKMVREMTGVPVEADQGELRQADHRPSKYCTLLWSFPTPFGPLLISGVIFQEGAGERLIASQSFHQLAEQVSAVTEGRGCYRYSSKRQLLLQAFPMDHRLPGLAHAATESWIREAFAQALGLSPKTTRIHESRVVSYQACRRCTFRYQVEANGSRARYIAKVLPDNLGAAVLGRLKTARARLAREGAAWETPAPITYLVDGQMLLMEAIEGGVDAKTLLARAANQPEARHALRVLFTLAAQGLERFQRAKFPGLSPVTPDIYLQRLDKDTCFLPGLERLAPGIAVSLRGILRRLEIAAARMAPEPMGLGHGSFRHTQFLLLADRAALIDLDELCLSGASADAGNFLAYLDRSGLRKPQFLATYEECGQAFSGGLKGNRNLSPEWLSWYRAAALVKWALRSYAAALSSRRLQASAELTQLAERLVAGLPAGAKRSHAAQSKAVAVNDTRAIDAGGLSELQQGS